MSGTFLFITPLPLPPHSSEQAGGTQDVAGTADPNWPNSYCKPYNILFRIKLWGKEGGREDNYGVCLSNNHYTWWSPTFLEIAEHQPDDGKWWMLCFTLLASAALALSIKLSLSQQRVLTFALLNLSWGGVSECMCGAKQSRVSPEQCIKAMHFIFL